MGKDRDSTSRASEYRGYERDCKDKYSSDRKQRRCMFDKSMNATQEMLDMRECKKEASGRHDRFDRAFGFRN